MAPIFSTFDKHLQIASELCKTRTAPSYTKFSPAQLSARIQVDILGALVYALRYLSLIDDQEMLLEVSNTALYTATALKLALFAPIEFDNLQPVAHHHAAEALDMLCHQPIDSSSTAKQVLWRQRVENVLKCDGGLPTKIADLVGATLKNEQLFESAFAAFDPFEHTEIPSLSSDRHRAAIPHRPYSLIATL